MLSIQKIRQEPEVVKAGLKKRHFKRVEIVDQLLELDERRRSVQQASDQAAAAINASSKKIGQLMATGDKAGAESVKSEIAASKEQARQLLNQLGEMEEQQRQLLLMLPNIPHTTVPEGHSPEQNVEVRRGGTLPEFEEDPLPHWELARNFNLIDFELGVKLTGGGFPVYIGQGAKLQRALISYFLDYNTGAGYTEYYPPYLVNAESAYGTGQLPDKDGQMYEATADGLYLIPTAEVPVTNIYRDTIVTEEELPIKMTAYTPCFRREAGSYGKEVRGLNRVHQFDKVEIVQITKPEHSYEALEEMVAHVEGLLQQLGLHYRILRLCGGDMGFTSAITYDFEVYSIAQERWLEVSSVSNFESFQANRLKLRYKDGNGKMQMLHTLNGSSLALPRIMACLLEQYQDEPGIKIPQVLENYFREEWITA